MKKIWYLCSDDKKDKRVARLFIYENNGQQKAQLDLISFSEKPDFSKVEIFFYIPRKATVAKLCFQPEDSFLKDFLKGKGFLEDDTAKNISEAAKDIQIRIVWGGKVYDSFSCTAELPPEVITESKAEEIGSKTDSGVNPDVSPETEQKKESEFWLDDDSDDASEGEAASAILQSETGRKDIRRVVELEVLEEEMIFRSLVHNSFLLHGYYNYGHLVIDERNGAVRLGVPGNYYEREKAVAAMFGFPDFEPAKDEMLVNGTFGYYFTAYT